MPKTRRSRFLPGLDARRGPASASLLDEPPERRQSEPPAERADAERADAGAAEPVRAEEPLSVSEVNRRANALIGRGFGELSVTGELSALSQPPSGHWYMTLKDAGGELRCVMFRADNARLGFEPKAGEQLVAFGRLGLYEARGQFQMIATDLERGASGELLRAFEALKRRLHREGLFDAERKRALPSFTRHIALVTSSGGAAVHDVVHVLSRRFPALAVSLLPASVQGERAAAELAAAIARANRIGTGQNPPFDAILLARGGGGPEDLAAFNDEALARAIADSALAVVTGIGHEVDYTIADLVADERAPTPSAAAELLSPNGAELRERCDAAARRMRQLAGERIAAGRQRRRDLRRRLRDPAGALGERMQRCDELDARLERAARAERSRRRERLTALSRRLRDPAGALGERRERLRDRARRLRFALHRQRARLERDSSASRASAARAARLARSALARDAARFRGADARLLALSPRATLERGYAILRRLSGRIVRDATDIDDGAALRAELASGSLALRVTGRKAPTGR